MAMKLVKKTAEYTIFKRSDDRYAVKGADKKPVNGDDKVKILLAEELIKVTLPAEPEAVAEEEAAGEDAESDTASAETAEEPAAEEAPAEEDAAKEA